jgi:polysaccharide export outer membrane protein
MIALTKHFSIWLAAASLGLASCKLGRDDFDPAGDPIAAAAAAANPALPFIDFKAGALPDGATLRPSNSAYVIRPGDGLEIEVSNHPESLARSIVLPDGMLYYDVADGVHAAGKTLAEVERELSKQLLDDYAHPIVSANLYDVQGSRYTILGQVKEPGSYPINTPTTLLNAIASAGGMASANLGSRTTDLGDLSRSVIVRDGKLMPVDFEKLIEGGDMRHNVYVKPGDYIFMPSAGTEKVYVLGSVVNPTTLPYSSRVTLISAIASAGGLQEGAFASGVLLIRGSFHEPKVAGVNLRKIVRGKAKNFKMQPGDIIWVPKRPWHKLEEYAKLAMTSVATSMALNEAYKMYDRYDDYRDVTNNNTVIIDTGSSTKTKTRTVSEPAP